MTYDFHELALLFPLMEGAALEELIADIKANGLRDPIVLLNGKVLDGRNRFLACEASGVEPRFRAFGNQPSDGDDPRRFIVSENLHRRHLNTKDRADIAAKLVTTRQGERTDLASNEAKSISQPEAAELMNVSRSSVQRAVAERKPKRKSSPAVEKKRDDAVRLHDQGKPKTKIAQELGIPPREVTRAVEYENLRREGEARAVEIKREDLSLSAQQKFDTAIEQHKKKLTNEFEDRVREATVQRINETSLPFWLKKLEDVQRDIDFARRSGIFTKAQFKKIAAHLHPDHIKDAKSDSEAFDLFRKQELALVNKTETPTPGPSTADLPQSYADLMEAKRRADAARKNKRQKNNIETVIN